MHTPDERLYQTTDGVGILQGHHVVRPFDSGDLGIRQELPGEGGDLLGQRTKMRTLCAFGDENRLLNAAGLGLPELRFQDSRDFVAKEECGLAYSPIEAGRSQTICEHLPVRLTTHAAHECIERRLRVVRCESGHRRCDEPSRELLACGDEKAPNSCRFEQDEAGDQVRALKRELQSHLAARRVSYPMKALESQVVSERGDVACMVGNGQVTGRHAVTVTCPPHADHPETVERPRLAHRQEPVAEDPCMDRSSTVTAPDGNVLNAGKYVVIWTRQSSAEWKIHRDIFNWDVPPAPASTEP